MAELNSQRDASRACLVLEEIPMSALLAFVEDFTVLKTQERLMQYLPELRRVSVSVLGKGVGPALLIETEEEKEEDVLEGRRMAEMVWDESKVVSALKSFVGRVVVGMEACPYTKSVDVSASGLESRGVVPGPVG